MRKVAGLIGAALVIPLAIHLTVPTHEALDTAFRAAIAPYFESLSRRAGAPQRCVGPDRKRCVEEFYASREHTTQTFRSYVSAGLNHNGLECIGFLGIVRCSEYSISQ